MFNDATRQNFTQLPAQKFVRGGRLYFDLPKAGLLSRLFLTLEGTMTIALGGGTATISERMAYNLIKRIRLIANSGASIFDVTGYGTYLINSVLRRDAVPEDSFTATDKANVYNAPVASGANTWKFGLEIPVAINERDPIGLILLQNNATQLTLEIEFNQEAGLNGVIAPVVVTGACTATLDANVNVLMEYFTVPRNQEDYPSLNVIHQWLEQQDAIASAGVWTKALLRGNTYMRLIHYVTINNALNTTAIERLRILYNQSEVPYVVNGLAQLFLQRARYGSDLKRGTFIHDWYMSAGQPSLGTSRDFINSANVTEFQSEITIASGTSVPAGASFINTITEQLIKIG